MNTLISRKNILATSIFYLLIVWVSYASVGAQDTLVMRGEYKPGKLESFLTANPSAILVKKEMGKLISPTSATFTAIVASDPVTKAKLSGLEVRFQGADQMTVYQDEDCIKRLRMPVASWEKSQLFEENTAAKKAPRTLRSRV